MSYKPKSDEAYDNAAFENDTHCQSASDTLTYDKPNSSKHQTEELPVNSGSQKSDCGFPKKNHSNKIPDLSQNPDTDDNYYCKKRDPKTIWSFPVPTEGGNGDKDDKNAGEGPRDTWDNPIEFLLSCISMSVGLGNVWRFPFVAYQNGGGAFLIPYLIVLTLIGRPIYYLEMCMGQFSRFGPVKVWAMAPLFKGVGYGEMIGTICVVTYYCTVMATTIYYFIFSFSATLPWSTCGDWGKELCNANGTVNEHLTNATISELYYRSAITIADPIIAMRHFLGMDGISVPYLVDVFPQKDNIDDGLGKPDWQLTLCLGAAWIMIFFSLAKGVKSSGKVAYFTAIFPYVVLIILLVRGVTLKGAVKGIKFFITPKWNRIVDPEVWYAAVSQCFFSLATGFGPIIMFSSYNPFRHNVYKDALIISVLDTCTSLLAGCTIFAILGFLAEETGQEVKDVAKSGTGLAFISYPAAISQFTFMPQFFAVMFFLMLFTLGIGSATSLAGAVITVICDQFPLVERRLITAIVCWCGFLAGLLYITPGGGFMIHLVDYYGANFVIYIMAMVEVAAVAWVYGLNNFCQDIEFMIGVKVGWYFKACWGFIIPVGLFGILIYTFVTAEELTLGGVEYPKSAIVSGWILATVAVLMIPSFGLQGIYVRKSHSFAGKVIEALQPSKQWGPQNPELRRKWLHFTRRKDPYAMTF